LLIHARDCGVAEACVAAGVVHPGVGQGLTKVVDLCQARAPYHAEVADVRPRLSQWRHPIELVKRHRMVKERHPELSAFSF